MRLFERYSNEMRRRVEVRNRLAQMQGNEDDEEDEQDLHAERNAFSGHLRHLLLLENAGSIFLAVVVIFVRGCDAEQDSDNERDNDENCPREE